MIERFEMERMQSTWENLVDYDMSESGVRPLTLRELVAMGFDLDEFLDQPLGYSQSNGTIELRERIAASYPGTRVEQIEVTNGTSEANYLVALSLLRPGDVFGMELPNYMQMPGVARSLGAEIVSFHLQQARGWEPDWQEFDRAMSLLIFDHVSGSLSRWTIASCPPSSAHAGKRMLSVELAAV